MAKRKPIWQQNVIDEKADLDAKIKKLSAYLRTKTFGNLNEDEQHLIKTQWMAMKVYCTTLAGRIDRF